MVRKTVVWIVDALSVVIILSAVFVLLSVLLSKNGQAPSIMGYSMFRVMTGSMEPTIETDSLIVVKQTDASELSAGDVISFYSRDPSLNGAVNTHRIVSVERDGEHFYFTTRGDANNADDLFVTTESELIGRVVYSSHILGKLVRLISNPLVFIPIVILPLCVMLAVNLNQTVVLAKKIAREEEEREVREAISEIRSRNRENGNEE